MIALSFVLAAPLLANAETHEFVLVKNVGTEAACQELAEAIEPVLNKNIKVGLGAGFELSCLPYTGREKDFGLIARVSNGVAEFEINPEVVEQKDGFYSFTIAYARIIPRALEVEDHRIENGEIVVKRFSKAANSSVTVQKEFSYNAAAGYDIVTKMAIDIASYASYSNTVGVALVGGNIMLLRVDLRRPN
jgi:hypothetical protein